MSSRPSSAVDVALVGAGIHSATLGMLLRELDPGLTIRTFERLDAVALESTDPMNNAGTGHAANCELNYTPAKPEGGVDPTKAFSINEQFEVSLQFWSSLVSAGRLPKPSTFMNPCPHMSLVLGQSDVAYLRARHEALHAHHFFASMDYSEDRAKLAEWAPLTMQGRENGVPYAATRVDRGSDIDFGSLTKAFFDALQKSGNFSMDLGTAITDVTREADGTWRLVAKKRKGGGSEEIRAKFVFLGAGGGALPLLLKSGIPEGKGYGGFPISGQWLVCAKPEVIARHEAKVYGKAAVGAPPMSVPHLDTRIIDGKRSLLFGPYAGFSTKFLKEGSYWDLPGSVKPSNLLVLASAGLRNLGLVGYLVGQVLQNNDARMKSLRDYFPEAKAEDWSLAIAGQRVQIMKPDAEHGGGKIEFGTEVVSAADGSIAALLGASPGASTAVPTMVKLIEKCFADRAKSPAWQATFKRLMASYGLSLAKDKALHASVRAKNNEVLGLKG
ncbi:MAG TPA: malate dehydrogenase (quinone) [Rectinemataceae bacterium]|nr:malate dehydrogenase (quinone) [Rectinemataceae bacterium]